MNEYILTTNNDVKMVTNKEKTHRAQFIHVDEALADGLTLKDMIEDYEGFMEDWIPVDCEEDWGSTIEVYESDKCFSVSDL